VQFNSASPFAFDIKISTPASYGVLILLFNFSGGGRHHEFL
jgi:hypothetical protein